MIELCLLPKGMAIPEAGAEVASTVDMAGSAIPLVIGVSDLADIATGILFLKRAKLGGNNGNSYFLVF